MSNSTLKWNARHRGPDGRFKGGALEGNYRGVKLDPDNLHTAYQFGFDSSSRTIHTVRWDGTMEADSEPIFRGVDSNQRCSARFADWFDRLDRIPTDLMKYA